MEQFTAIRDKVLSLCEAGHSLAIMSHINPDGDGFCASLALQSLLKQLGYESGILVDDLNLDKYQHLLRASYCVTPN